MSVPDRVIVLGGGIAGLACARELKQRGYQVLIVEARSRIGGRLKGEPMATNHTNNNNNHTTTSTENGNQNKSHDPTTELCAVDLGGALIHGIDRNPVHTIVTQMGVPLHVVNDDCLLLDENGWPFDPKMDDKLSTQFNACLDETFRRVAEIAATTSTTTVAGASTSTTAQQQQQEEERSFGELFDEVCQEKNLSTRKQNPLWKWHQANLELPSGADFSHLGFTWNDDEPYGFTGAHAAVTPSWKFVMEHLAEGLDILYDCPVTQVQVVLPDGTTPDQFPPSSTTTTTTKRPTSEPDPKSQSSMQQQDQKPQSSEQEPQTSTQPEQPATQQQPTTQASSLREQPNNKDWTTAAANANAASNGKKTPEEPPDLKSKSSEKQPDPVQTLFDISLLPVRTEWTQSKKKEKASPARFSRRIRGEDVNVRRSSRSNKGVIQLLQVGHQHKGALCYDDPTKTHEQLQEHHQQQGPRRRLVRKANADDADAKPKPPSSTVLVTLKNGRVLQANAIVCTLPLGVLQIPPSSPGHVKFLPPLPSYKRTALDQLGCGLLNKCAMSFSTVFWQDSDFLGLAGTTYSYLVLNVMKYTQKPILVFMYGGSFAKEIESWTDAQVVQDCLQVLQKICGKRQVPNPVDYCVTRWGQEPFSRMAFTYIPKGVNGPVQLAAAGDVLEDPVLPKRPFLMFAGEHTTPYHPSTMHGAFLSGIREAYRYDLFVEPALNHYMEFDTDHKIYEHTFFTKRVYKQPKQHGKGGASKTAPASGTTNGVGTTPASSSSSSSQIRSRRRRFANMSLRKQPKQVIETVFPLVSTKKEASSPAGTVTSPTLEQQQQRRRSQRSLTVHPKMKTKDLLLSSPPSSAASPFAYDTNNGARSFWRGGGGGVGVGDNYQEGGEGQDHEDRDREQRQAERLELEEKKRQYLNELEDRTLLRSLESYGRDTAFVRSKIVPVFGSTRKRNADQIRHKWQQLQAQRKRQRRSTNTATSTRPTTTANSLATSGTANKVGEAEDIWKEWEAQITPPPPPSNGNHASTTTPVASMSVKTNHTSLRRSKRDAKPRVLVDFE